VKYVGLIVVLELNLPILSKDLVVYDSKKGQGVENLAKQLFKELTEMPIYTYILEP
jgi:hypothetical protein